MDMELIKIEGGICAPRGFTASGIHCGIRKNKEKRDLALIYSDSLCSAAAVYTQNKVKGAPILVTRKNIADGLAQAVICNSGNANTCNADGEEKAQMMCDIIAKELSITPENVIVASTGVIGQVLPIEPIQSHAHELAQTLSKEGSADAAEAILTTDTCRKEIAVSFELGGKECRIAGMAKGSGMIHPNMATMLCFLTTDVSIDPDMLKKALSLCVTDTFNMVSVDGDTSTNDMVSIMASGQAGNAMIDGEGLFFETFTEALLEVCRHLAKEVAADGEGASKALICTVEGAPTKDTARKIAKSVITSSLFKAAMFGSDANWGRVLCAIGYTDANFNIDKTRVTLSSCAGSILVCENAAGVEFSEEEAKVILSQKEITILIELFDGEEEATAYGCDLTYDYVKINGDYRT